MVQWLRSTDADFEKSFRAFLGTKREVSEDVDRGRPRYYRKRVRADGDTALFDYSRRFDRIELTARSHWPSAPQKLMQLSPIADPQVVAALTIGARSHRKPPSAGKCPRMTATPMQSASNLGSRWTAIESVGLYVPGGTASYPSSVLMNAVPAKVAGVQAHCDGCAVARWKP